MTDDDKHKSPKSNPKRHLFSFLKRNPGKPNKQENPRNHATAASKSVGDHSHAGTDPPQTPKKKWERIEILTCIYTIISGLALFGTIWAIIAAVDATKETRHEFTALNEPVLQVDLDSLRLNTPIVTNNPISVIYVVRNLKPADVKILTVHTQCIMSCCPTDIKQVKATIDSIQKADTLVLATNQYLTKDFPMRRIVKTNFNIDHDFYDSFSIGKMYLNLLGAIRYKNSLTEKENTYWFEIRMTETDRGFYRGFFYNENEDENGKIR